MNKGYPWIDKMRIVAAILVVGIHVSPLLQIHATSDFFLTRVLGRLAVPFFMITTSFFLFSDGYPSKAKIKKTIWSLLTWYGIAIIIYIPLMIYNQYFLSQHLFNQIIKDLLIDGTFYHLWYFPAIIIGLLIVLLLKKIFPLSISMTIVIALYVMGLCGDSYYGIINELPLLHNMFNGLFQYMDYTRNGFFYAPMFLMIGSLIHEQRKQFTFKGNICLFVIGFLLMMIEAWILYVNQIPKHDSMYIMLPIVSYIFFDLLIQYQGKRYENLKNISLYIYIIHPWIIVVVRIIGKLIYVEQLISNNFIQYICVLILSIGLSMMTQIFIQGSENDERTNV